MPPTQFSIVFDSPTAAYYAGTTVTGRVVLTLDKPTKARGLKFKIDGSAHVSWNDTEEERDHEGKTERRTVRYYADEEYFSNSYFILGSANGDIEIPIGNHSYPFSTTLPPQLPSTFDGEFGYVRYTAQATIDRPWKSDHEAKATFQVVTNRDLNYTAVAKEPVKKEEIKTFCCLCCTSAPMTMIVCLPYTGFVPEQVIPVTVEIDNASNVGVDSVVLKVKKKLKWKVRMPRYAEKTDSVELVTAKVPGIVPGDSRTWTESLTFPKMPFVNLDACSIIDVEFEVKVTAEIGGVHRDVTVEIPIILGNIPIMSTPFTPGTAIGNAQELMGGSPPAPFQPNIQLPTAPPAEAPAPIGFNINGIN